MEERKFKIWYQTRDDEGNVTGTGVYHKEYCYYGTAQRIARQVYGGKKNITYEIGILNPYEKHFEDVVCDICGKTHSRSIDPHFGHMRPDHHVSIRSSIIPSGDGRRWYSRYYDTCPDCIVKIKNFVDSLKPTVIKGVSGCTWSDGLGTDPDGHQCGECDPHYAKRCPHLKEGKDE